jgi:CRP/FNR family transcriptional regulator
MKSVGVHEAWSGQADCLNCTLRTSVLFAGLEKKDFEQIHQPIDQFTLAPGALLYRAGDPATHMYTVRSGLVKLVQYLPDGSQRIVRLVRSTDVTGLESLLGQPYQHHAVALQPTEVCSLPVAVVEQLSRGNPALHRELLSRWQRALSEADAWLTQLSTGSSKQRTARLLLRLADDRSDRECIIPSREDMGAMLGITTETASRTIAEFKRRGLIAEARPNRFLLDITRLRQIAEE